MNDLHLSTMNDFYLLVNQLAQLIVVNLDHLYFENQRMIPIFPDVAILLAYSETKPELSLRVDSLWMPTLPLHIHRDIATFQRPVQAGEADRW